MENWYNGQAQSQKAVNYITTNTNVLWIRNCRQSASPLSLVCCCNMTSWPPSSCPLLEKF